MRQPMTWFRNSRRPVRVPARRRQLKRWFPHVELLEDRAVPAGVLYGGTIVYNAFRGENNDVHFANGPLTAVTEAPGIGMIPLVPCISTELLKSLSWSVFFSAGPVEGGFGGGILPFGLPCEAVLCPGPPGGGSSVFGGLGRSIPQEGSSVVAGVPVTQNGNVFYQVKESTSLDTISSYQIYQAVVDPTTAITETENNDDLGLATDLGSFSGASSLVQGNFNSRDDVDYFKLTATAGQRVTVIMDNNPERSNATPDTNLTSTDLSLLDALGNPVIFN